MLIGIETDLPEIVIHPDQAAGSSTKERMTEDKSVTDVVAAVQYKKGVTDEQMDNKKISRPSMITSWVQTGQIMSKLVHVTPRTVRKF